MRILFKKQQHKLAHQIVANYLIAKDALNRAFESNKLNGDMFFDAIEKLTRNTVDLLVAVVGIGGLVYYTNKYHLGLGDMAL